MTPLIKHIADYFGDEPFHWCWQINAKNEAKIQKINSGTNKLAPVKKVNNTNQDLNQIIRRSSLYKLLVEDFLASYPTEYHHCSESQQWW